MQSYSVRMVVVVVWVEMIDVITRRTMAGGWLKRKTALM